MVSLRFVLSRVCVFLYSLGPQERKVKCFGLATIMVSIMFQEGGEGENQRNNVRIHPGMDVVASHHQNSENTWREVVRQSSEVPLQPSPAIGHASEQRQYTRAFIMFRGTPPNSKHKDDNVLSILI